MTAGGSDLVTFASGTTNYTAMVANRHLGTVTAAATDSGATIAYLDGSDVTLAQGDNVIRMKVTASDGATAETYTVTVNRAICALNTGDIWCGVVTVGEISSDYFGFLSSTSLNAGGLTDNSGDQNFRIATREHVVYRIAVSEFGLNFGVTWRGTDGINYSNLHDDDRARLVLQVDGHSDSFAFSDATIVSALGYEWSSGASLDWSSTSEVTVRVREAATPPDAPTNFTATVGDTQVTLAWKAVALDSGVTGHEFRYKTDGDYPMETWTAIADSGPDETNEDSFTVTGLTNEEAHTFELRAVNTAGGGDAAEAGPVTPTPGICDRTQQVQDAILAALADVDDCAAVTVANLDSITDLQMNSKSIDSLKKGDFAGLTSLTILNLTRNTLTSLPEGIFAGLAELTELVLDQNQLATLPEAVFDGLVKLEDISLGGNSLTGLRDDEFSELTALEDLNLGFNELSSLPDEVFSDLTALTGLYLDNNNLDSLDAGLFSGLTALTTLQLDNNNLTSLDAGLFSGLTALDNNALTLDL